MTGCKRRGANWAVASGKLCGFAGALTIVLAITACADRARAAANIPPEVQRYHLGSCDVGDDTAPCLWDCEEGRTCCGEGACGSGRCDLDVADAVSARFVVRATDCPSGGGAIVEFGLRATTRAGQEIVVPSRAIDLCTADVQCGAFTGCAECAEPGCPPLCADPETICPPPLPQASLLCENAGGGPLRPGGRPEVCRDPPGSDQLPTPGRRMCSADLAEPLRFERWLRQQPLLQAIRDDLAAYFPQAAGPAVIHHLDARFDDPFPDRVCGESLDPAEATPCCDFVTLPDGAREARCCATVAMLREPRPVPVPADVASAPVALGSVSVAENPCAPLCGNGRLDPGEQCETTSDAACPGQCLPPGHAEACRCNRPPRCDDAAAASQVVWPPDHAFVPVEVTGVEDPDGDPVAITITAVAQDESPLDPQHRGRCMDAEIHPDGTARLRAERKAAGDGRVYHVGFVADDGRGTQCTGTVPVCVPRDRAANGACRDQGPRFDSTVCP